MKKFFSFAVAALLAASCAISASAYETGDPVTIDTESYPGSLYMYDLEPPTEGEILIGTFYRQGSVFGDGYTEAEAVDGDYTTYFAPTNDDFTPVNQLIMKMDEAYRITEIRFFGRDGKFERTISLCFDASNDGENWTTLYETQDFQSADDYSYVLIPASDFNYKGEGGFTYFRIHQVDTSLPLNIAEVEWWGVKADAATDASIDEMADGQDVGSEPIVAPVYTYPGSGLEGTVINGTVFGADVGYGDNADVGAKAAFDGNPTTYYDPVSMGEGYAGMDAGEVVVLDKVAILSRSSFPDRFAGAQIDGTNTPDDEDSWVTLWTSEEAAASVTEYTVVTSDMLENNTGYQYYRYYNLVNHGDVAEVEFYKVVEEAAVVEETAVEEVVEVPVEIAEAPTEEVVEEAAEEVVEEAAEEVVEEVVVVEEPAVEEAAEEVPAAAQTFDAAIIAAVTAIVSLAGYSVSKKH